MTTPMKTPCKTAASMVGALSLLLAHNSPADTIRVNKLGTADYTNIVSAVNAALDGDTVLVEPGDYYENDTIWFTQLQRNVTLIGAGPQFTKIYCLLSNYSAIAVGSGVYSINIKGFSIMGDGNAIWFSGNSSAKIQNCILHGSRFGIFQSQGVNTQSSGSDIRIVNCTIADNWDTGIYFRNNENFAWPAVGTLTVNNTIIANPRNFNIHCASHIFLNCDSWTTVWDGISNTDCLFKDPLFVNREVGNYLLKTNSPCRNSGLIGELDPDGSRADMGAFGGAQSGAFWPYPVGCPIITELTVNPGVASKGGKIAIRAVGSVR